MRLKSSFGAIDECIRNGEYAAQHPRSGPSFIRLAFSIVGLQMVDYVYPLGSIARCRVQKIKRISVTLDEDLEVALEHYIMSQEAKPSLTAVVQAALRQF